MFQSINLKALVNNMFVTAENGGGTYLIANRAIPKEWETFTLVDPYKDVIEAGDGIVLQASNESYVSAEGAGTQDLVANRLVAGPWEEFTIYRADGNLGKIVTGDRVVLKAVNGRFVTAEDSGGGRLNSSRTAAGLWETFTISLLGTPPIRSSSRVDFTAEQHFEVSAELSQQGLITGKAHIWTDDWWVGYTGGVTVAVADAAGNILALTPLQSWGVDGKKIPSSVSGSRTPDLNQVNVGADIARRATSVVPLLLKVPNNQLISFLNEAIDLLKRAVDIGKSISDIISLFRGAGGAAGGAGTK